MQHDKMSNFIMNDRLKKLKNQISPKSYRIIPIECTHNVSHIIEISTSFKSQTGIS